MARKKRERISVLAQPAESQGSSVRKRRVRQVVSVRAFGVTKRSR